MTSRSDNQENHVQTGVRVPKSALSRADKLAEVMTQPGILVTRADVMRSAMLRGLDQLEAERKKR